MARLRYTAALLPWLAIQSSRGADAQSARLAVGTNVHVSATRSGLTFSEVTACVDPSNPRRLIAAAMYAVQDSTTQDVLLPTVVFRSRDGGQTWAASLDTRSLAPSSPDPSCAFGPSGEAYYTVMTLTRSRGPIALYRSADAGTTWSAPTMIDARGGIDRQWVAVDNTAGPNRGRVYVTGFRDTREPLARDFVLYRSSDAGKTFELPVEQRSHYMHNGNAVVLSDGTLVSLRAHPATNKQESPNLAEPTGGWPQTPVISVVRSADGGQTIEGPIVVSELRPTTPTNRFLLTDFIPSLAVDAKSSTFRDRLYATWLDARSGRLRVMASHSSDGGKRWSPPAVVADDRDADPLHPERGPDNVNPTVAVAASGAVAIMWYDRRDNPDFGYWPRIAVSLDGGETWSGSVRVSERPMVARLDGLAGFGFTQKASKGTTHELVFSIHNGGNFKSGDTAGLVGLADSFQAFWIDNRTGRSQIWSAPVNVAGTVGFVRDVSDSVQFRLTNLSFDPRTRTVSAVATMRNISSSPLRGPFSVQVATLRSGLTRDVRIVGADNARDGVGAVWTFPSESLAPGAVATRQLSVAMGAWESASLNPLELTVRVLAR